MDREKVYFYLKKCLIFALACSFFFIFSAGIYAIDVGEKPHEVEDVFIEEQYSIEIISWVEELEIPWQLIFLPESDRALVTERPGRIRLIEDGQLASENYVNIDVAHIGEGGLMGMDHHPDFPDQPYIYVMYTYMDDGEYYNRVSRFTDF